MLKLSPTHRDRLRDRPNDAGATFRTNHPEKVPTPAVISSISPKDEGMCSSPFAWRRLKGTTTLPSGLRRIPMSTLNIGMNSGDQK